MGYGCSKHADTGVVEPNGPNHGEASEDSTANSEEESPRFINLRSLGDNNDKEAEHKPDQSKEKDSLEFSIKQNIDAAFQIVSIKNDDNEWDVVVPYSTISGRLAEEIFGDYQHKTGSLPLSQLVPEHVHNHAGNSPKNKM